MHHLDSWIKRDQLDVTCFFISLFNAQHVSDINASILRSLRLICWVISWVVLLWYDVCYCYFVVWLGWCGIRMQASASDIKLVSLYSTIINYFYQYTNNQVYGTLGISSHTIPNIRLFSDLFYKLLITKMFNVSFFLGGGGFTGVMFIVRLHWEGSLKILRLTFTICIMTETFWQLMERWRNNAIKCYSTN